MRKSDLSNSTSLATPYPLNVDFAASGEKTLHDLFRASAENQPKIDILDREKLSSCYMMCDFVTGMLRSTYGDKANHIGIFYDEDPETGAFYIWMEPDRHFPKTENTLTPAMRYLFRDEARETIDRFLTAIDNARPDDKTEVLPEERVIHANSKMDMLDLLVAVTADSQPDGSYIDIQNFRIAAPADMKHREVEFLKECKTEHIANVWRQVKEDPEYLDRLLKASFAMPFLSLDDYLYKADFALANIDQDHFGMSRIVGVIRERVIQEDGLREKEPEKCTKARIALSLN